MQDTQKANQQKDLKEETNKYLVKNFDRDCLFLLDTLAMLYRLSVEESGKLIEITNLTWVIKTMQEKADMVFEIGREFERRLTAKK